MYDLYPHSTKSANKLWAFAASFLAKPTKHQVKCQAPKPILLDVAHPYPFAWVPTILPNQIVRIGNLYILAVPGEFTTMSGRRLRNAVELVLRNRGQWEEGRTRLVIAGLANSYSHYTATWEEFQVQRYEGASTLYGPHSSAAYRQIFTGLINSMLDGTTLPAGPTPLDMRKKVLSFHTPVVVDGHPWGIPFGSVRTDVDTKKTYTAGDTVKATFWCASPRNNVLLEGSFMAVDKKTASAVAAASSGRGHLLEGRRTLYLTDDDGDGDYDATHVLYDGGRRPSLEAVDAGTRTGPAARVVGDIMEAAEEEGKNYYEDAPDSRWDTVATDSDWSTKFRWKRKSISESLCSTEWTIPADATSGTYRFRTMGVYKSLTQKKYSYSGHSSEFKVQV